MEVINVLVAGAAAWFLGAVWYMVFAKPWMAAANVPVGADGKPESGASPMSFILSALAMIVVAGMMRHVLSMAGITGIGKSAVTGIGVGLFLICPWIAINNMFPGRPFKLTLIDGGYAVSGCTLIGIILALF